MRKLLAVLGVSSLMGLSSVVLAGGPTVDQRPQAASKGQMLQLASAETSKASSEKESSEDGGDSSKMDKE